MRDRFEHPALDADLSDEALVRQLENLQPGAHLCPIYRNPADKLRIVAPYLHAGVERGEKCLYIADAANVERLRAHGLVSDADLARGVLDILTARDAYVRNGRFDPNLMLEFWAERLAAAQAAGFAGLRVIGETSWALGPDIGSERLIEYEARLNEFLPATGIRALCLYDWTRWEPRILRDVLRTHPLAMIDHRLHRNVYYEPGDVVLGKGDVEGVRVSWMVNQLQSLTRRETALVELGHLALEGELADLMRGAPALVASELGVESVEIFELLPAGDAVRMVGTTGPHLAASGAVERLDAGNPLTRAALIGGRPLIISDWRQGASSVNVVICIGAGERAYGMLSVHGRVGQIFSDDEFLFLESVGIVLAYASTAARRAASFRALVEHAPDVIVRFDADLQVTYVNPAIERLTGTAAESLVGKTSRDLGIPEPALLGWELVLRQVWRTGREQAFELTLNTLQGARVFDSRIVPEIGPDGEVQSLLSISRDVSEQRSAEAERSALYRELVVQQNRVQELLGRLAEDRERSLERRAAASELQYLTDRERQILRLMAAGRTNREIGAEIGLTTGTVKNQVAQILSKLNASDRTQAAVRAVELGLIDTAAH
ncbi:MAG TPA: MEDS domain-containing protein [Chloroflexota bacterium]|nr:MEDS domain-containing protein [Chloroflexota bacterium]